MGNSSSLPTEQAAPLPPGFSVAMSEDLARQASRVAADEPMQTTRGQIEEQLKSAFDQGAEYAAAVLQQQHEENLVNVQKQQFEAVVGNSEDRQTKLAHTIEELHKREYR